MKAIVICPYFGKLPINFQLWLNSCEHNINYDFYIMTDDTRDYYIPKNVTIKIMPFDDLKEIIQSRFDFNISLEKPFKLCDYKPAYGYIFDQLVKNYEYWGYCDLDLIFGDLNIFYDFGEDNLDKISYFGHLSLLKNNREINEAFMTLKKGKNKVYKQIFSSSANFGFDESNSYGVNYMLKHLNKKIKNVDTFADINPYNNNLNIMTYNDKSDSFINHTDNMLFKYENGRIYGYSLKNNEIYMKEFSYIHFQKRRIKIDYGDNNDCFVITPHNIIEYQEINKTLFKKYQFSKFYKNYYTIRYKAFKKKIYRLFMIRRFGM